LPAVALASTVQGWGHVGVRRKEFAMVAPVSETAANQIDLRARLLAEPTTMLNGVDKRASMLADIAADPSMPAVIRGQSLAELDQIFANGPANGSGDAGGILVAQRNTTASNVGNALTSDTRQECNWIGQNCQTIDIREIRPGGKFFSEKTDIAGERSDGMQMLFDNGKSKGTFGRYGCHATALLNAINAVAGTSVTPENARDAASNYAGTVAVPRGWFPWEGTKNVTAYEQLGKTKQDFDASRSQFWQGANKVKFTDISLPKGDPKARVSVDLIFRPDAISKKTIQIDGSLETRIFDNVKAGNPILIGSKNKGIRHSAMITGYEQSREPGRGPVLIVRDNWKSDNGEAKRMTLTEFKREYGNDFDFVWAVQKK
jgi:hypothetical protein